MKFVKEVEGHVQTITFWPSTGTVESSLNHPAAIERKQFYRNASVGNVKYFLGTLFARVSSAGGGEVCCVQWISGMGVSDYWVGGWGLVGDWWVEG